MVKTPCFQCRGRGLIPGRENSTHHGVWPPPKECELFSDYKIYLCCENIPMFSSHMVKWGIALWAMKVSRTDGGRINWCKPSWEQFNIMHQNLIKVHTLWPSNSSRIAVNYSVLFVMGKKKNTGSNISVLWVMAEVNFYMMNYYAVIINHVLK